MAVRQKKNPVKTEHMIIVMMGDQVHAKCCRAFSKKSKTEHGTIWVSDVTCEECIDIMAGENEANRNYFNNREIQW